MAHQFPFIDTDHSTSSTTIANLRADYTQFGVDSSLNLNVSGVSTFSNTVSFGATVNVTATLADDSTQVGAAGSILSSTGSGIRWIAANTTNVNSATNVGTNANATDADQFVAFMGATSGNNPVRVDAGLKYNPSSNILNVGNCYSNTVVAGDGSGSVAMTTNDGYGNANICFNHKSGVPDTTGSSGRIECAVDGTTSQMYFELWDNVTSGSATGGNATNIKIRLRSDEIAVYQKLLPNTDSSLDIGSNTVRFANGYFDSITGSLTGNADTATTATTATNVTVTANNSTDETVYPIFVDGATGAQGAESDTGLTYNPNSGALTSGSFVKSGGSSSQFLKADGSVDTNTYVTSNTTYDLLVPASTTSIRLDPSSGSNDDITITGGTNVTVTRTSATELTIAAASGAASIPSGSVMLFYQGSAPTGWTKVTTQNNKALRVVSGTGGGTGGNNNFTTVFSNQSLSVSGSGTASGNTGSTVSGSTSSDNSGSVSISGNCGGTQVMYVNTSQNALSIAQLAAHTHQYHAPLGTSGGSYGIQDTGNAGSSGQPNVNSTGSGSVHHHAIVNFNINGSNFTFSGSGSPSNHNHDIGNHSHSFSDSVSVSSTGSLDMRVKYIDVIICSKD